MGGSDYQPDRCFSDWPKDVNCLAEELAIKQFGLLGNSGGGPYVAVCAAKLEDNVTKAVIVSGGWRMDWPEAKRGMPFVNRLVMQFAKYAPSLLRLLLSSMGSIAQGQRDRELAQLKKRLPPADYQALTKPGQLEAFGQSIRESMLHGTKGPAWELGMYVREFDFKMEDVKVPITLFHGEKDVNAPIALARRVTQGLPNARLITFADEAHLSTPINHQCEILCAL